MYFLSLMTVKSLHTPPARVEEPPPAALTTPTSSTSTPTKNTPEPTSKIREIIKMYNSRPQQEAKPFEPVRLVSTLRLHEVHTQSAGSCSD